jgi:hypothetical protein
MSFLSNGLGNMYAGDFAGGTGVVFSVAPTQQAQPAQPNTFTGSASVALGGTSAEVKIAAGMLAVTVLALFAFYYWTRNHQL